LVFKTHNGGRDLESFELGDVNIDHGDAVSFLISGKQALGMTEGYAELSEGLTCLSIQTDPKQAATVGMLTYQAVDEKKFTRLSLSQKELDDTSRSSVIKNQNFEFKFKISHKSV
jgi:hypothetical protein